MNPALAMKTDEAFELVGGTADVQGSDGHVVTSQINGSDARQAGSGCLCWAARPPSLAQQAAVAPRFFVMCLKAR
ncbi:hypothetical protein KU43P_41580 [Pseudomonas sp. KU43P]|nr:hypothetical protein KU43P_41580 [Pseudomonas sp. KU43P]